MAATAFGHALETVNEGLTVFRDGRVAPVPLVETRIDVGIRAGLATVTTLRRFRNAEDRPIEALLTLPVGFDAAVTGLAARIDGCHFVATAKEKSRARADYEAALDEGRLTVLHEELLRGVHMLSVGNLAPGKEVEVEITALSVLAQGSDGPFLRIPVTAGQLYGVSPFAASDDLVTSDAVRHRATLSVAADAGRARLADGRMLEAPVEVTLDAAIEIVVAGGGFGTTLGHAADGRPVRIDLCPVAGDDRPLDLAVLVDHSGSTRSRVGGRGRESVWEAMRDGLRAGFAGLGTGDRIDLWEFDAGVRRIGAACGPEAAGLTGLLSGPAGGTELGQAVRAVLASGARDILVLTDGQTWAATVDDLMGSGARISAILVGRGSLDAMIGQLCAASGGQVFYAPGADVAGPIAAALRALRRAGSAVTGATGAGGPLHATAVRGGVEIAATWSEAAETAAVDATGRFAAALALPLLDPEAAEAWAREHALCTHRTSLVLVDEAGEAVEGMAQMRKVPLLAGSPGDVTMAFSYMPMVESRSFDRAGPVVSLSAEQALARDRLHVLLEEHATQARRETRLRTLFADLPWDALADMLLRGDLSSLDARQREAVATVAARDEVRAFARGAGLKTEAVAVALIADLCGGRLADRFVRRLLGGKPAAAWNSLRLAAAAEEPPRTG